MSKENVTMKKFLFALLLGGLLVLALATVGRDAITNSLYSVSALDAPTYIIVFALVTSVSLAAVLVPVIVGVAWMAAIGISSPTAPA